MIDGWWWPALLVLGLGAWGLGRPGAWTDEMATWGAARLSLSELFTLSRTIDTVMAPYYAAMHVWSRVVGTSDIALRLPSVLAGWQSEFRSESAETSCHTTRASTCRGGIVFS